MRRSKYCSNSQSSFSSGISWLGCISVIISSKLESISSYNLLSMFVISSSSVFLLSNFSCNLLSMFVISSSSSVFLLSSTVLV